MIAALIRFELRRLRRERILWWFFGVVVCLFIASIVLGMVRHNRQATAQSDLQRLVRQQWVSQPDRHPHRVAHYGSFAFRPPDPLSLIEPGAEAHAGTMVYLEAHRRNPVVASDTAQQGSLMRFGELSVALILQIFVPLFLILLAFGSIARERETRTWELVISQGVSPRVVVMAKGLAVFIVALLVATLALVVASAFALWHADSAAPDVAARLVTLWVAYVVFFAICSFGAVALSFFASTARAALIALLALWIASGMVLPRMAAFAAEKLYPAPSRAELDLALAESLRQIGDSHNPSDPYFARLKERYLARHEVERVEELPINFGGIVMREAETLTSQVYHQHYERLFATWREQEKLVRAISLWSPFIAIKAVSAALAATDTGSYAGFQQQAEAHRYDIIQRLNELHAHRIHWHNDRAQRLDRSLWRQFPAFHYQYPSPTRALHDVRDAASGLVVWLILVMGLIWLVPNRWEQLR